MGFIQVAFEADRLLRTPQGLGQDVGVLVLLYEGPEGTGFYPGTHVAFRQSHQGGRVARIGIGATLENRTRFRDATPSVGARHPLAQEIPASQIEVIGGEALDGLPHDLV